MTGEWVQVDGLRVPKPEPREAIPKTYVTIRLEITGAGLPEGEQIVWQSEKLLLTKPNQLKVDILEQVPESWQEDSVVHLGAERRVSLSLEKAVPASEDGKIYELRFEK